MPFFSILINKVFIIVLYRVLYFVYVCVFIWNVLSVLYSGKT